ncbi:MAG: hypothetical protein ABSG00_03605 [Terracidiphilus sp.]|jgi:hypothetical protein
MSTEDEAQTAANEGAEETSSEETKESCTLKVIGWLSVGITVAALGIFVGRELRSRYKFKRRTPYDFYAHAGEKQSGEFGLGV